MNAFKELQIEYEELIDTFKECTRSVIPALCVGCRIDHEFNTETEYIKNYDYYFGGVKLTFIIKIEPVINKEGK